MLLAAESRTPMMCSAVAALLIAATISGCTSNPSKGPAPRGGEGQKPHQACNVGGPSSNSDVSCTETTGQDSHPIAVKKPEKNDDFSLFRDNLCFADDALSGSDTATYSQKKKTQTGVEMWIMPEVRMLETDPTKHAPAKKGMVVAMVRNNGSVTKYGIDPQHDALIWLNQDVSNPVAVLFTYDPDDHVVILAEGSWKPMDYPNSNDKPKHAEARWEHPSWSAEPARMGRPDDPGSGWIACLSGCCTPDGLFLSEDQQVKFSPTAGSQTLPSSRLRPGEE